MPINYQLIIAYNGTQYKGWQKTTLGNSIEQMLEQSLEKLLGQKIPLQAASRTDAGVHAEGQVVNFVAQQPVADLRKFLHGINGTLPKDIRALKMTPMPIGFHPTLQAKGKHYQYGICNGPVQFPFYRHLSWHFPYPIDVEKMEQAAQQLLGTHDFSAFCNERQLWTRNPVCTLESLTISREEHHRISIDVKGDHFLYKMVRNLVGTLAYAGCGKIPHEAVAEILVSKMRAHAGMTAPAHGLCLKEVFYD